MARLTARRQVQQLQHLPCNIEPAPQDATFAESQVLKSIAAGLTLVGFDGAEPAALEMFRGMVEEYTMSVLADVREGMQAQRRTTPAPTDFSWAMSRVKGTRSASELLPHITTKIPEAISYPFISDPPPASAPAPDFSELLQPLLDQPPTYVPAHFPSLPSQHAWKLTPVYPTREKDARKMREKATEEGMLAEGALRKLAAAAKASALKADGRRSVAALAGVGKSRDPGGTVVGKKRPAAEMLLDDVLGDVGLLRAAGSATARGESEEMPTLSDLEERVVVNAGVKGWRGGAKHGL